MTALAFAGYGGCFGARSKRAVSARALSPSNAASAMLPKPPPRRESICRRESNGNMTNPRLIDIREFIGTQQHLAQVGQSLVGSIGRGAIARLLFAQKRCHFRFLRRGRRPAKGEINGVVNHIVRFFPLDPRR